ncbi:MAG: hypothetical protein A3F68_04895 [Acidobacteria bacterium RIFCSPLOWO2_12_FULL_54_10]|nr:MAG: hypothetical protein A3F68_04895 [Acidobacteria bacterium RIFCSPLOWO2_12_FULL_54_10]
MGSRCLNDFYLSAEGRSAAQAERSYISRAATIGSRAHSRHGVASLLPQAGAEPEALRRAQRS